MTSSTKSEFIGVSMMKKRDLLSKAEPPKHDPIEDTEEFKTIIDEVNREAESLVKSDIRVGRYYFVEQEKKRILKEKYNIDWKTTDEMNPTWDFI